VKRNRVAFVLREVAGSHRTRVGVWQFRALCVLVVLTLACYSVSVAAGAAAQTDADSFCAIMVTAEAFADHPGKLAFQLWAPGVSSSTVSGTLVVYANGQRFDVPFAHAEVAPEGVPGQRAPAPFVVQFPDVADLESAYVGSLLSQDMPHCLIYSPFVGPKAGGLKLLTIPDQPASGLPDRAVSVVPIKAPLPQPALPMNCKVPYRAPYVGYQASAVGPLVLLIGAKVTVTAQLKSDGKVLGYSVAGAPDGSLKNRAIQATVGSKFFPETYRCQAVAGQYVFKVNFGPNETHLTDPMGGPMDVTQGRAREDVDHSKNSDQGSRPDRDTSGAAQCARYNDA
jgi:hypothetical protein